MNIKCILLIALTMIHSNTVPNDDQKYISPFKKYKKEMIAVGAAIGALGGLYYWLFGRNIKKEVKTYRAAIRTMIRNYGQYFIDYGNNPNQLMQQVERNNSTIEQFVIALARDLAELNRVISNLDSIAIEYEGEDYGASILINEARTVYEQMNALSVFTFNFRGHFTLEKLYREMGHLYNHEHGIQSRELSKDEVLHLAQLNLSYMQDPHPLVKYAEHIIAGTNKLNRGIAEYECSPNRIENARYRWATHLRYILTLIKDTLAIAPEFAEQKRQYAQHEQQRSLVESERRKALAAERKASAAETEARAKLQQSQAAQDQARTAERQLALGHAKFEEEQKMNRIKLQRDRIVQHGTQVVQTAVHGSYQGQ